MAASKVQQLKVQQLKEQLETSRIRGEALANAVEIIQEERDDLRRQFGALKEINSWALKDVRCNEPSPQGDMLCDREPGHDGAHVNWQGAEWGGRRWLQTPEGSWGTLPGSNPTRGSADD